MNDSSGVDWNAKLEAVEASIEEWNQLLKDAIAKGDEKAADRCEKRLEALEATKKQIIDTIAAKGSGASDVDVERNDMSMQWKALRTSTLGAAGSVLSLPNSLPLPLPQSRSSLTSIFVRACYIQWFALFVEAVALNPDGAFALSGTPGIGKTLSALFLFVAMQSVESLKNRPILYQHADRFYVYAASGLVFKVSEGRASELCVNRDTFYVVDGKQAQPLDATCLTLFISSPRNDYFKDWCYQNKTTPWYFPVWELEELEACAKLCYRSMNIETLVELYRQYGGVARYVFWSASSSSDAVAPPSIKATVADANARKSIRAVCEPSQLFPTSHMLLHIIVDDHLRFRYVDLASSYVGVLLFKKYFNETMDRLSEMLGSGGALAGHLFECYGHYVFEHGGKDLQMRSLEDNETSVLHIPERNVEFFRTESPPESLPANTYFQPLSPNYPAVDAITSDGMPQFTVSSYHPVIGVKNLAKLASLYQGKDQLARLLFVVPPNLFDSFQQQPYQLKGGKAVSNNFVPPVSQFVVKLDVGISTSLPQSKKLRSQ